MAGVKIVLKVEGLFVQYKNQPSPCVKGVSFAMEAGEILALVGPSGCGKTSLARAILGLLPPSGVVTGGKVSFQGEDLLALSREQRRQVLGGQISMLGQQSLSSLSPVFKVGGQFARLLKEKRGMDRKTAKKEAILFLASLGLEEEILKRYPHTLSGGQRQRVGLAMALSLTPQLLIIDEPTTALDSITKQSVLEELRRINKSLGTGILLISHDLAFVENIADKILILDKEGVVQDGT